MDKTTYRTNNVKICMYEDIKKNPIRFLYGGKVDV